MIQTRLAIPAAMSIADETIVFDSADDYRAISAVTAGFTIPLGGASQGAARAVYRLPDSMVCLQHTFPRIMEAHFSVRGAMVVVPMGRAGGFIANGAFCDEGLVLVLRGSTRAHFVEAHGNEVGFVCFGPTLPVGQWLVKDDALSFLSLPPYVMQDIRERVLDVARERRLDAANDLEAALVERFGEAIQTGRIIGRDTEATRTRYADIVERIDGILAARWAQPVSNAEIAREIGLSSRTLHEAVHRIRGMSLQRYLRLRRLWSARKQLIASSARAHVHSIAAANGFRHMGEFAAAYRATFGELPSATAARDQPTLRPRRSPPCP
jgi:AraC family ethanolamine operon transcriptional activator